MSEFQPIDPGPMARLREVMADEHAPDEIFRRLTEGESLVEIFRSWKLPKGKAIEWFSTKHRNLLDAAEKTLGIEVCHAVRKMTDKATKENYALVKMQTDRYLRLASMLNAERYSPKVEHEHRGGPPVFNVILLERPGEGRILEAEILEEPDMVFHAIENQKAG